MTEFDVAAGKTGLADALIAHGGLNFFDEITSHADIQTHRYTYLTKGGTTVTILEDWGNNSAKAMIDNTALTANASSSYNTRSFGIGVEADTAIVLFGNNDTTYASYGYYSRPLIICKSKNGGVCVISPVSVSGGAYVEYPQFSTEENRVRTQMVMINSDGVKSSWRNGWTQNNNSINVLNTATFWTWDDVAKDVYFCTDRPFAQKDGPFMLEINGESFMSVAYNSIIIKTT